MTFLTGLMTPEERAAPDFSPRHISCLLRRDGVRIREAFAYGLLMPGVTPSSLLPLVEHIDCRHPWGCESFVFAEKAVSAADREGIPAPAPMPARLAWIEID